MPMYNLIQYSHDYSKTSGGLWQYYRNEVALNDDSGLDNFSRNSGSSKIKQKITGSIGDDGTKAV